MKPVVLLCCVSVLAAWSADIYAIKMEIVQTPEGQETVFQDSVSITDGETQITAGQARLNEQLGRAVIADSVIIASPDAVVYADSAVYLTEERRTHLYGNVRVVQDSLLIAAPRLVYLIPERMVVIDTSLVVEGSGRGFRLSGERGSYDLDAHVGVVDSSPVLVRLTDGDSVTVIARQVRWHEDRQEAQAEDGVRVFSGQAELSCDLLLFYPEADSGFAVGSPAVTDSVSRTAGDTIVMLLTEGHLSGVMIRGGATGSYRTDADELVEVAGELIRIGFASGELIRIEVEGLTSGRLVRKPEPKKEG